MSLRPEDLQTSAASVNALEAIVREQLQMIDNRIRESDRKMGENLVIVDLPEDFGIPGLEKREQQRFVYSKIVQHLTERGWDVRIYLQTEPARVYIKYIIEFNAEEVAAMTEVLKKAQIKANEIEAFCNPKNEREAATDSRPPPPAGGPPPGRPRGAGPEGGSSRLVPRMQPPR